MDISKDLIPQSKNRSENDQSQNSDGKSIGTKRHKENDANQVTPHKKKATDIFDLKGYSSERRGERPDMQDAHTMLEQIANRVESLHESICRLAYFAVYDGHGGDRASNYAEENLIKNIIKRFPKGPFEEVEKEAKKCLVESFKKTDEDFLLKAKKSKPSWKDGSTAVGILAINNVLFISNLGDSKAILCRYNPETGKYVPIPLTKDHSPSTYEERIRIQKAGGVVREGRVMGVLEVSRSLGDGPYKNHGVTCIPDVKRCHLTKNDRFILIACDGLWKTFTSDSAVKLVLDTLQDSRIEASDNKCAVDVRMEMAAQKLTTEAVKRLSADNVTVVLVRIIPPNSVEST